MMNTKRLIFTLLVICVVFSPGTALAHGDETGESAAPASILQQILTRQKVETVQQLDCDKVTEHEWEELGNAVMSGMHPDPTQHSMMDNMMGGEGSDSLTQAHIQMGQNYLGCTSTGTGVMNMMGQGMMDSMDSWNMANMISGWGNGYGILGVILIFWIVIIAALVAVTRYFWKKGNQPNTK